MSVQSASVPKRRRRGLAVAGLVLALVAIVVLIDGVWDRKSRAARLEEKDTASAEVLPTVALVTPKSGTAAAYIDLPGRLEAYARAPIYARVGGFLKAWHVDIGERVKAGQLLAEIEVPDLDQQLAQAKGALGSAESAEALSKVTAQRWTTLGQSNTLSKQAVDEKTGDLSVKEANVRVEKANVERLEVLAKYKNVTAPFGGVITARNTDVGMLIGAGSSAAPALFVVSDVGKLRLTINVPQNYVPAVPIASKVTITVPEHPGKTYSGVVEASARSVDAGSGTTHMQVLIENATGELMPGAFANARVELPLAMKTLSIPSSALVFGQNGLRVATIDAADKVTLKSVTIARDLGQTIEIASGLAERDRVIESPPDGLNNGDTVRVIVPDPGKKG